MTEKTSSRRTKNIIKLIVLIVVLAVLVVIPIGGGRIRMTSVLILVFLYMAIAQMWNLLAGYSGLVSLGAQAFVGLGGYSLAMLSQVYGLPLWTGFVAGAVISVIFALIISMPIFKMKGVYFTVGTWIVAECLLVLFSIWKFVNYSAGYNISATYKLTPAAIYYVALAICVGAIVVVVLLLRSKFGLSLMAMRDNEAAAEIRGVKLYRTKLICFLIASAITGIAGAGLYLNIAYITPPSAFNISWTVAMCFIVVIGGIGTVEGPIIGAIIYVILNQLLYSFPGFSMLIMGVIAIIIIILAPKGIMGVVNRFFNVDLFGIKRRL
ncbi:MAG: branched-chain amino acid ABC transporter permease [Oscillospiraceae bacterium]|nr:branched-chain amino acid ABC transporter permease [Oscillospiraceae bacterium]